MARFAQTDSPTQRVRLMLRAKIALGILVGLLLGHAATVWPVVVCTPFGSLTATLQLCKPADAEVNWGASYRNNLDVIDALFAGAGTPQFGAVGVGIAAGGLGTITATGPIVGAPTTDISQFYAATSFCKGDTATLQNGLLPVRLASNDWAIARTAAGAETINIRCNLAAPTRTTSGKGWKLTAFKIVQQITVAALTSNTFNALSTTTYANNVANAVAAYGGSITITMPTATQANPYVTTGGVGTPAFMVTPDSQVGMDFTVVLQNTGAFKLYGVSAAWTEQD